MSVDASSRDRTPRPGGGSCPPPKTSYLVLWVQGTALVAAYGREWPPLEISHALLSYEMAPPGRSARTFPHLVSPLPRKRLMPNSCLRTEMHSFDPFPSLLGKAGMGFLIRAWTIHKGLPDGSRWGEANSEAPVSFSSQSVPELPPSCLRTEMHFFDPFPSLLGKAGMGFLTRARTIHKGLPDGSRWGEANSEAPVSCSSQSVPELPPSCLRTEMHFFDPFPSLLGKAGMGFLIRARTIHKGLPDGSRWGEANSCALSHVRLKVSRNYLIPASERKCTPLTLPQSAGEGWDGVSHTRTDDTQRPPRWE